MPSATTHQHYQVCHPLLLQAGEDDALTQPTFHTMEKVIHQRSLSPLLHSSSDHPLPQLSAGTEDVSLHHVHLLFLGGTPVWLGLGHSCHDLQSCSVSADFCVLPVTIITELLFSLALTVTNTEHVFHVILHY